MKKISEFLSDNIQLLKVKFSIYLNRRVFVMVPLLWPSLAISILTVVIKMVLNVSTSVYL